MADPTSLIDALLGRSRPAGDDSLVNSLAQPEQPQRPPIYWHNQLSGATAYDEAMRQARGLQAGMTKADPIEMAMGLIGPRVKLPNPIKAYHGSPHDFDKFDLSKIGTGEGAQAYGHGLYFAENEGVAKSYKGDPGVKLVRALNPFAEVEQKLGHMYEVALHAKPEQFIDAIAPTSRLPDNAQLALKPYRDAADQHLRAVNPSLSPDWAFTSISHIGDDLKPGTSARMVDDLRKQGIHGARYLDQGSRQAQPWIVRHPSGGIGDFPTEQAARAYVAKNPEYTLISPEAQRTNNYVVWTPEIIEILRKYGIAGPAALGAANAMSQEDKPQQ